MRLPTPLDATYETVRVAVEGHLGTITLDRQKTTNTFSTGPATDLDDALEFANERFAEPCTTADATEGIDAFLSGREPDWLEA